MDRIKDVVRKLPAPIKHVIHYLVENKFRKYHNLLPVPKSYSRYIAPNLSIYVYWIFSPLYLYFKKRDILFLINVISNSPGHMVTEMDYFIRLKKIGNKDAKYIYVTTKSEVAIGAESLYKVFFFKFIVSDLLYLLLDPFLIRYKDLCLDIGLSVIEKNSPVRLCKLGFYKENERTLREVFSRYSEYYKIIKNQDDLIDLNFDESQLNLVMNEYSLKINQYIAIQIKDVVGNGTGKITDPETYVKTINYFLQKKFLIVFCGREKMPSIFEDLGVINYSESRSSSFFKDLLIVKNASLVISSASGFANLAAVLGVPLVYTNQWNFNVPPSGKLTITVPALIRDTSDWKFKEQIKYFYSQQSSNKPLNKNLQVENASGEDIFQGCLEALSLHEDYKEPSELQCKFKCQFSNEPVFYSNARVSNYFIEKHQNLLM